MALLSLDVKDFRCLEHAELEFDPRCTLIAGDNASGKTSLLEAIHILSCGRSFRTNRHEVLIRHGATCFQTIGRVQTGEHGVILGIQGSRENTEAHIAGRRTRGFSQHASTLPVLVIDPEVHRLLEDGPQERRRFLDWGVFHVEPQFVEIWRRYQRALRQRNAALKSKLPRSSVTIWDDELISAGTAVAELRQRYIDGVQQSIGEVAGGLLELPVRVEHRRGWTEERDMGGALEHTFVRDQRFGVTTVGPHRADLAIYVDGEPAKERISRGQQKLLAAALMLAQLSYRARLGGGPACLLLDDPAAELDVDNLKKLLTEVAKTPAQLVVTSLDVRSIDRYLDGQTFHVKQGRVNRVL